MTTFAYSVNPMDFGWENLPTLQQHIANVTQHCFEDYPKSTINPIQTLLDFVEKGFKAAKQVGWEGDARGNIYVWFLPNEYEPMLGLVWKQENNGDTFIVSPVRLPWAEKVANANVGLEGNPVFT
jgi:hypothetical protein